MRELDDALKIFSVEGFIVAAAKTQANVASAHSQSDINKTHSSSRHCNPTTLEWTLLETPDPCKHSVGVGQMVEVKCQRPEVKQCILSASLVCAGWAMFKSVPHARC